MTQFKFYQDVLVKMWTRNTLMVEADTEEEALAKMEEYSGEDLACIGVDDIECEETENMYDTEEAIDKKDNFGNPTIIIMDTNLSEVSSN